MSSRSNILTFLSLVLCLFIACSKDPLIPFDLGEKERRPVLPETPFLYGTDSLPPYFYASPLSSVNSIQNPITADGATLGRVLFYDRKLSANNAVSCGSCHLQSNAFADPRRFSAGFEGVSTHRNSMAIQNTRFSLKFFWDQRAGSVEEQVLIPIADHIEMGMNLSELVAKLQNADYYPSLFQNAFGSSEITTDRISNALAQFIHSLMSYRSRYDSGMQNGFSDFTSLETDGKNLFQSGAVNCNECHATGNFYEVQALNNGLDSIYADNGIGALTGNSHEMALFKVPSLRNVEVTSPYMHDGRFSTLEEVVEHYNSGLMQHPNLDQRLTTTGFVGGPPKNYSLTAYEKASLVAFLKTLTDQAFITDERFSDPFR